MNKIVDNDTLAKIVADHKERGRTVVFTNGAFDILHVGHIRYLQGASEMADVLVCAVNSDVSVCALKGQNRPIVPGLERMEIVAALECVDWVTPFDETNVERLLLLLRPDIHAKGTDYTKETVPEVETVKSYGGQVAITGDPKDHNTTDIIKTIQTRDQGRTN